MSETATLPPPAHRGKVRDVYDLGDRLLLVATDRLSAFDVVMGEPIPDKGKLLTGISAFWFEETKSLLGNHLISLDRADFPAPFSNEPELDGRSMLVHKADRVDVECVVRGYLAGSGWASYQKTGQVLGHELPPGLTKGAELPEPIFTPTTKADVGHDEPISFEEMCDQVGTELAGRLRDVSLRIYNHGHAVAKERGFLLADTKFEFRPRRRGADPHRRGAHSGLLSLLAGGGLPSRRAPRAVGQAGRSRPSRGNGLEQAAAASAAPRGNHSTRSRKVSGCLPCIHRP